MSSSGSHSGEELDPDFQLALYIVLERSKVETMGSSGSASSPLPRMRSSNANAGSSRPVRSSDRRPAQSTPPLCRPLPPSAACPPPRGQRWVLVPAPPARGRTRTPESEARAARRERQQQRDRWEAELDEDVWLLEWVYRWSLTTAETDVRWLRRKNAKALRFAIE
ncbi:hypothetical protein D1007_46415 [Hordeum vulgare]|nr:hypothetical protein D1007_46415 [Hordeum vulgare]